MTGSASSRSRNNRQHFCSGSQAAHRTAEAGTPVVSCHRLSDCSRSRWLSGCNSDKRRYQLSHYPIETSRSSILHYVIKAFGRLIIYIEGPSTRRVAEESCVFVLDIPKSFDLRAGDVGRSDVRDVQGPEKEADKLPRLHVGIIDIFPYRSGKRAID